MRAVRIYAWHLSEHMPEEVGIHGLPPGTSATRRARQTHPKFLHLYENPAFEITQRRLTTSSTERADVMDERATAHFKTTSRSLARVVASFGSARVRTSRIAVDVLMRRASERNWIDCDEGRCVLGVTGAHVLRG